LGKAKESFKVQVVGITMKLLKHFLELS